MNRKCNKCYKEHELFYFIQKNMTKHLVIYCPVYKKKGLYYQPFEPNLPIKVVYSKKIKPSTSSADLAGRDQQLQI